METVLNTCDQLWLAVQGTAEFDEETQQIENPVYAIAYEYRYYSGRQRYLVRPRDPNMNPVTGERWTLMGSAEWRDYAGESVHADYAVDVDPQTQEVSTTPSRKHLSGIGYDDCLAPGCEDDARYYHADQIGSTRSITQQAAVPLGRKIYTAFGERADTSALNTNRYGYAGAHGYEEPIPNIDPLEALGWLHVGERYYDPAAGRFMQRDPIGIQGGLNVYAYLRNNPTNGVDPLGLSSPDGGFIGDVLKWIGEKFPANTRDALGRFGKSPWTRRFMIGLGGLLCRLSAGLGAWQTGSWIGNQIVYYTGIENWLGPYLTWLPPLIDGGGGPPTWTADPYYDWVRTSARPEWPKKEFRGCSGGRCLY